MSEDEYWTGIAKRIKPEEGEDLETQCKRIYQEKGYENTNQDSYADALIEYSYYEYAIANGVLYDTSQMTCSDCGDICEASPISEDTAKVTLKFYNGGTYFGEMFEEAIAKMNETKTEKTE